MTRKDYIQIAAVIRAERDKYNSVETVKVLQRLVGELGYVFKADNSAYNGEKFHRACGF